MAPHRVSRFAAFFIAAPSRMRYFRSRMSISVRSSWQRLAAFVLCGGAVGLVVACSAYGGAAAPTPGDGGSTQGDGGPDGAGSGAVHGDPKTYADGLCAFFEKCQPSYLKTRFGDGTSCRSSMLADATASLNARGNVVTQDQLTSCMSKLGVRSCADDLDRLPECDFRGTLDDGVTCVFAGQCKGGACIGVLPDGGEPPCHSCEARAPLGTDCANHDCAVGLICFAGKCAPPKLTGEDCDPRNNCEGTLDCVNGKCVDLAPADQSCDLKDYNTCDGYKDLLCMPSSSTKGTCKAVSYAKVGETCGFDPTALTQTYCIASYCSEDSGVGTCLRFATAGEACSRPETCANDLACIVGRCVDRAPACQ
jgi:hypothetical protein